MLYLATFLVVSFAVYACIKWWFDTDIISHILKTFSGGKVSNITEVKEALSQKGRFGILLVELFECPWCLSFHFSFWLNLLVIGEHETFDFLTFLVHVIGTAGGGMYFWMKDLKD